MVLRLLEFLDAIHGGLFTQTMGFREPIGIGT